MFTELGLDPAEFECVLDPEVWPEGLEAEAVHFDQIPDSLIEQPKQHLADAGIDASWAKSAAQRKRQQMIDAWLSEDGPTH